MKHPILASLIGVSLAAVPALAEDANQATPAAAVDKAAVISQVSKDLKAEPAKAAEIVKKAILDSKADAQTVAQIVRAAILAAPNQVHAIYNAAIAVAPDAAPMTKLMIAGMLSGDEVAQGSSADRLKAAAKAIFEDSSDISVDTDNKSVTVIVNKNVLKAWTGDGTGNNNEVKIGDFSYTISFGSGTAAGGGGTTGGDTIEVIIIEKDTTVSTT